jgi:hypothetical protein
VKRIAFHASGRSSAPSGPDPHAEVFHKHGPLPVETHRPHRLVGQGPRNHGVRKYGRLLGNAGAYLVEQYYLHPHPAELSLRSHL